MSEMKIVSVMFDRDIENMKEISDRWFLIPYEFNIAIYTEKHGVHRYHIDAGFHTDFRSGPNCVDWYLPHIGTQKERRAYVLHDLLSYSNLGFSFDENNELFYYMLRKAGHGYWKASTAKFIVGLNDNYFGEPLPTDREYVNVDKIHYTWSNR